MPNPLRDLEREVRNLVVKGLRERRSFGEISGDIDVVLRGAGIDAALQRQLVNAGRVQFDWINSRLQNSEDQNAVRGIVNQSAADYARTGGVIRQSVVRAVERGIASNAPTSEIENDVAHQLRRYKSSAATITNSALGAFDRANTFRLAGTAKIQQFRYSGPGPERAFCAAHLGRVYTLDEIRALSNGQGLPVQFYCGGYNCRHHWEPVFESAEPATTPLPQPSIQTTASGRDALTEQYFSTEETEVLPAHRDVLAMQSDLFGRTLEHHEVVKLAGAMSGAEIEMVANLYDAAHPEGSFKMLIEHPLLRYGSERTLYRNDDGELEMHNDILKLRKDAPSGLGTRIFATQVEQARALGVSKITVTAAGHYGIIDEWSGYYTWPRLGYDGPLPSWVIRDLPESLAHCETIGELYETEEGRQWWKINGSTIELEFDLDPNSLSSEQLKDYLAAKGIKL